MACEVHSQFSDSDMWVWSFARACFSFCQPPIMKSTIESSTIGEMTFQPTRQPSTQMSQLPPEIMRLIQQHVLHDSRHEFLSTLQVCRAWTSLGKPLLWKDVVLTMGNLESFAEAVRRSPDTATYTQNLTILSSRHDYLSQKGERARQWLPLIEIVSSLPNLKTFSLFIRNSNRRSLVIINGNSLNQILQALPLTVSSLEIDLMCAMIGGRSQEHHPCVTIRKMLPRLKHLRLSRGIWCHKLLQGLETPCPDLKTVLLDDSRRRYQELCERVDPVIWRSDLIGEYAALAGRDAMVAGLMPALESFNILVPVTLNLEPPYLASTFGPIPMSSVESSRAKTFPSIQRKDVLHQRTIIYPIAEISIGSWFIRHFSTSATKNVAESIGHYDELIPLIESEIQTWSSSTTGWRSPDVFPKTFCSKAQSCLLEDLPFDREANENVRPLATLQHWERRCGRKLLYPRTHEGLERGAVLSRDVCEEESPSLLSTRSSRSNSAC